MDTEFSKFPVYFYGYSEIETFCLSQRERLVQEGVGLILGVLRGGGIPALMLSQMLGIPVDFVYYDRREARPEIKNNEVLDLINACVKERKKILLVEDIAGVGRTLVNCYEYLLSLVEDKSLIKVFALVHHEGSRAKPDYYKDCSGIRAVLPWERYVTGRLCLSDFVKVGEALIDDQRYKKTLVIDDPVAPLDLRPEWMVDYRLKFDGDRESMLNRIKDIGPEEVYCNIDPLVSVVIKEFPFIVPYRVVDKKRYRMSSLD